MPDQTEQPQKKHRGGARAGAGRKKIAAPVQTIDGRSVSGKSYAQELIDRLNAPFDPKKETLELAGWRRLWDALDKRVALECRRYLYDKAGGKAVITVNHLHDKPIEVNATLTLGAGMRQAMQKADTRLELLNGGKSA